MTSITLADKLFTLRDALNATGKFLDDDDWQDDCWFAYIDYHQEMRDDLSAAMDKYDIEVSTPSEGKKTVRKLQKAFSHGLLNGYTKDGERDYNPIPSENWGSAKVMAMNLDFYKSSETSKSRQRISLCVDTIYVNKAELSALLTAPFKDAERSNAGRKIKYDYGFVAAVLCAVVEEEGDRLSQTKMADRLTQVCAALINDAEEANLPKLSGMKERVLRDYFNWKDAAIKFVKLNRID